MRTEKPLTTFQVAKICQVFHTTVINWVNLEKLKAYYTPGGHRRIQPSVLIEFMRKYELPIPQNFLNRSKSVLIIGNNIAIKRMLLRALQSIPALRIQPCSSGLEALIQIGREAPDLIILDINIPEINGIKVCQLLRADKNTRKIQIIAVSGGSLSAAENKLVRNNADAFFSKPISANDLKSKAARLLDLEAPEPALTR